jgi:hypothetical protein
MHDDNLAIMRICNDCKKTFITQSSIEEHIQATGHKDIVKTSSGIIKTGSSTLNSMGPNPLTGDKYQ